MSARLRIMRAGPLTTLQDKGRQGLLAHGISASGPMDRAAFREAGLLAGGQGGGIEFTRAGLDLVIVDGQMNGGWGGGGFTVRVNGTESVWPGGALLSEGDALSITPGAWGNYGYLRFGGQFDLPGSLGSLSSNIRAELGGVDGRALIASDELVVLDANGLPEPVQQRAREDGPIRFVRGLHWGHFSRSVQEHFVTAQFRISTSLDRMGVRLLDDAGVFGGESILSLVSEPVLPGDIQILGDGTPIVLMRDHQPTGGYPRIGTIISVDLDRFAQMRPGSAVAFEPASVEHAHRLLRSGA